ncbi:hypothetical protein LTR97_003437 [Elasticomyces elasticus]|uniref:DUF1993 domain-containing protein n=1 Tax=Elasticomyces elasticus TaxID=574655 RepID=A0AAN7WGA9_9PEZI|nr:hypothetical protein LTR97_003437 [Elasticomyces elasticus]
MRAYIVKAEQWCVDNDRPKESLLKSSLAPDMKTLAFQVFMATDNAKDVVVQVGELEDPGWPTAWQMNPETTLPEVYSRIDQAVEFLHGADAKIFDDKEFKELSMSAGPMELKFTGLSYVQLYILPNFFFHSAIAYGILRNTGAPLGKWDFVGGNRL